MDAKALSSAPIRTPLYDQNGSMTPAWALWFQKLQQRVGGGYSDSLGTANQKISDLETRVGNVETTLAGVQSDVATLEGEVTTLNGQVADLESRVVAIENLLASGFTGTIVTAQLTPVTGSQGQMVFNKGVLVSQTQAT